MHVSTIESGISDCMYNTDSPGTYRIWDWGFRIEDLGFRLQDFGFGI